LEELIKKIAVKHGVAIGRDDPILILCTLNEQLAEQNAKAQKKLLDEFKEEIEALTARWGNDARDKAERIITVALAAGEAAMKKEMEAAAVANRDLLRKEILKADGKIQGQFIGAKRIAMFNLLASAMVLAAAGLIFFHVIS
jgi:Transcriptional activator TraM